jgi:hypothetical protein
MISTALKHQTWSCMQPMLMGSWYVKYLIVNLNNTPISGRYCCSQIQHPNHTPLASHSFPRIIFLTIIWSVSLCWCLFIPLTTIMHWLKLPSCPAISYFSPSELSLQIGYCHWWLSKEFLTTKVWSFHRSFILCLKHMARPPVAICLLSFESPTCSFLCGPGFPDSAMQCITTPWHLFLVVQVDREGVRTVCWQLSTRRSFC